MIKLETEIEGKKVFFSQAENALKPLGFVIGGNWDYDNGIYDLQLWKEAGETIYLRVPFHVIDGELDNDHAYIEFMNPYVIKHVVNLGLDTGENALLATTGFNQFQEPLDHDAHIEDKSRWVQEGENAVNHAVQALAAYF